MTAAASAARSLRHGGPGPAGIGRVKLVFVKVPADLILPAADRATLFEICSWDGFRPATPSLADFPLDVVRFSGSLSPPVVISRARREETLKALPASLRQRATAAFERAGRHRDHLPLAHGRRLEWNDGPALMGVLNVTPDSFSDGGLFFDQGRAIERALALFEEGAAIVDVGGESTRPSSYGEAQAVSEQEEIRRVVPVIEQVRRRTERPISVDTRKAAVARAALETGADLVNDVSAFRFDRGMAEVVAEAGAGGILMHMRGTDPRTMQEDTSYPHLVAEIAGELEQGLDRGAQAGIPAERLAIDPGLGFGKSPEGNLLLLRHLAAFRSLGVPVVVGASRKGFVRRFSGVGEDSSPAERLPGSLACLAAAAAAGASVVRVHDVSDSARFLRMVSAIRSPAPTLARPAGAAAP
jgi:dihydropteroate synthase